MSLHSTSDLSTHSKQLANYSQRRLQLCPSLLYTNCLCVQMILKNQDDGLDYEPYCKPLSQVCSILLIHAFEAHQVLSPEGWMSKSGSFVSLANETPKKAKECVTSVPSKYTYFHVLRHGDCFIFVAVW